MFSEKITTQRINVMRAIVTWVIRGVALILVALGVYLFLKRFIMGLGSGFDFKLVFQTWEGLDRQPVYCGISMVLVGLPLGFWSKKIAAWVIAMPPTGCPQCGYAVAPPEGAAPPSRCPECGLPLDS